MTNEEWIDDVIGKPWVDRAEGPDAYDCWGLVLDYCRRVLGFNPGDISGYAGGLGVSDCYDQGIKSGEWSGKETGFLFVGYDNKPVHVGVVIGDRLIHSNGFKYDSGGQVCNHPVRRISRLFNFVEFFEYVGNGN